MLEAQKHLDGARASQSAEERAAHLEKAAEALRLAIEARQRPMQPPEEMS